MTRPVRLVPLCRELFLVPLLLVGFSTAAAAAPAAEKLAPATPEALAGDWLFAKYAEALAAERSPLAAALVAEPLGLVIRADRDRREVTVTNFHESMAYRLRGVDAGSEPGRANWSLTPADAEGGDTSRDRVVQVRWWRAEGQVDKLAARLWKTEGEEEIYRRLKAPVASWARGLLLAGEYRDQRGLPWRFSAEGRASTPDESFPYEISLDISETDCDYFQTADASEPGGQRRIGFAWKGDTLHLYRIAYDRPAPISCERESWVVLRPVPQGLSPPKTGSIIPEMGTISSTNSRLADALFSPVQQRVLALLFGQPARSFRGSEIIVGADSGTGAAHRQLMRLAESGLVTVTKVGNQKHYQANRESPVFIELSGLVLKTSGLVGPLVAALTPVAKEIDAAFVFGSIAKRADTAASDIDLMVITDVLHYGELYDALQPAEKVLGRTISLHLSTLDDWRTKRKAGQPFVAKVSGQPRIFVLGSEDVLA